MPDPKEQVIQFYGRALTIAESQSSKTTRTRTRGGGNRNRPAPPATETAQPLAALLVETHAYELDRAATRDAAKTPGAKVEPVTLTASEVAGKLVELTFENGKTVWVRGERLLKRLNTEQARVTRSTKATSNMLVLPVLWQASTITSGTTRGIAERLLLKTLRLFSLDEKATGAEVKAGFVKYIEDQLVEGATATTLAALNDAGSPAKADRAGWLFPVKDDLAPDAQAQITKPEDLTAGEPYLILLHGTASSTHGSFHKLAGTDEWSRLRTIYRKRLLGFEHRTLSQTPVANALELARLLPEGARLHLVSHSRGGLVGELLCLSQATFTNGTTLESWLEAMSQPEQTSLRDLWELLQKKRFRVERFVRVACPASGTTWLSDGVAGNFDRFLSALLFAMQFVEGLTQDRGAQALRALLAGLHHISDDLPGLSAQMPSSTLVRCLNHPHLRTEAALTVLRGDSNVGWTLWALGTVLADAVLREASDLVVNTKAMTAGIRRAQTPPVYEFLDRGSDVTHFAYFANPDTRTRLLTALTVPDQTEPRGFAGWEPDQRAAERGTRAAATVRAKGLSTRPTTIAPSGTRAEAKTAAPTAAPTAVMDAALRPTVFVLPGIMGSGLLANGSDVWLNYFALWRGGMEKLKFTPENAVVPATLLASEYGRLLAELERSYHVVPFPYDWRDSVAEAAKRLANAVELTLAGANQAPIYLLAHSMGGLVARAFVAEHADIWRQVCQRDGRLVMLGTPNNGAPAIACLLLGRERVMRQLALLDFKHSQEELLGIVRAFPGVLDLLPTEYLAQAGWEALQAQWAAGIEEAARTTSAPISAPNDTLLKAALERRNKLRNAVDPARMIYVAGTAPRTPLSLQYVNGELEITETNLGDGRVPYQDYGLLKDVPTYYANVIHGNLANEPTIFAALLDLLRDGKTERLPRSPQVRRSTRDGKALPQEIITRARELEAVFPTEEDLLNSLRGVDETSIASDTTASPDAQSTAYTLALSLMHGDLRYAQYPLAVGHYHGDSIASAEGYLNRLLGGALTARNALGLYPGAVGSAEVVYADAQTMPPGALIVGLGEIGEVTMEVVRQGITAGALRHALLQADAPRRPGETGYRSAALSALCIGSYAGRALSVNEAVEAIVAGVVNANRQLQAQGLWERVRIDKIEFVELYEDVAIQALQTLHRLRRQPPADFSEQLTLEVVPPILQRRRGGRYQRPLTFTNQQWWRRIEIVSMTAETQAPIATRSYGLLTQLAAHPGMRETQRQIIASLIESAAQQPTQRAYLADLLHQLLLQEQPQPTDEWLKFTVLTDRARAEELRQINQRYWIEQLIAQSIGATEYQRELAITLFELLMPNSMKRQTEDLLLVLDNTTAQYPWELLIDRAQPDKPLATQFGLLRQFKALEFRANPLRALGRNALVIGDSLGHQFGELPGARAEAQAVSNLLEHESYQVTQLLQESGAAIVTELFAREYQIIHLAAHGAFALGDARRQGVVLGNDQYLMTSELAQLRAVPDLVFVNCCHLGKLDAATQKLATPYPNRLAASIAEELIKIGVKAVVAAGWAVEDAAAELFAKEFYTAMLAGERFGDAVKLARQRTYRVYPDSNTWGAYQCYGSLDFTLNNRARGGGSEDEQYFYARREFRDELRSIAESPVLDDAGQRKWLHARVEKLAAQLPPEFADGMVLSDLANAWSKLGEFGLARDTYRRAIDCLDAGAPLSSIERFVAMTCRVIDAESYRVANQMGAGTADTKQRNELLQQLDRLGKQFAALQENWGQSTERLALQARIAKSQALLSSDLANLINAHDHYQAAAKLAAAGDPQPGSVFATLHWLACNWLLSQAPPKTQSRKNAKIALPTLLTDEEFEQWLTAALTTLDATSDTTPDAVDSAWPALTKADAELLRALKQGELAARKEELIVHYQDALRQHANPYEEAGALNQLAFLQTILQRWEKTTPGLSVIVQALAEIQQALAPAATSNAA